MSDIKKENLGEKKNEQLTLEQYKQVLNRDPKAFEVFLLDPAKAVMESTGKKLTEDQSTHVKSLITSAKKLAKGEAAKAPSWAHKLLDAIWDWFD